MNFFQIHVENTNKQIDNLIAMFKILRIAWNFHKYKLKIL